MIDSLFKSIFSVFVSDEGKHPHLAKIIINILLVAGIAVGVVLFSLERIGVKLDYSFVESVSGRLLESFLSTLKISVLSMALSLVIGIVSALAQNSRILIIKYFFAGYVKIIRGTPLLAQIYLFFYIIGTAFGIESRMISGVLILSVFEGAYISEIIRGSLLSIEKSQIEAGMAIGLTRFGIAKEIIFPQLLARTLPALAGQFASVIKDSSLLSVISVSELSHTVREISSLNFKLFECYFLMALLYLCMTLPVTFLASRLEKRFNYDS